MPSPYQLLPVTELEEIIKQSGLEDTSIVQLMYLLNLLHDALQRHQKLKHNSNKNTYCDYCQSKRCNVTTTMV